MSDANIIKFGIFAIGIIAFVFFVLFLVSIISSAFKTSVQANNPNFYDGITYERAVAEPSYCDNGIFYKEFCDCIKQPIKPREKRADELFAECKARYHISDNE